MDLLGKEMGDIGWKEDLSDGYVRSGQGAPVENCQQSPAAAVLSNLPSYRTISSVVVKGHQRGAVKGSAHVLRHVGEIHESPLRDEI